MRRIMKKILVFALVLTMMASNSLTAFAVENTDESTGENVCTGLEDCAASEHEATCAKAIADAQKAAEAANEGNDDATDEGTQPDNGGIMPASLEGQSIEPSGTITYGYVANNRIWGEATGNAYESFVIKVYSGEKLLVTTSLNDKDDIIDGSVQVTWGPYTDKTVDDWWNTTWETDTLDWKEIPDRVELYVDGVMVDQNGVQLNAPDNLSSIEWWEVKGVEGAPIVVEHAGGTENKYATFDEAMEKVTDGDTVLLSADTYTLPAKISSKITLKGIDKEAVVIDLTGYKSYNSISSITDLSFENLTIKKTNDDYVGFYGSQSESYKNCIINGEMWTYATTATFENCVFDQSDVSQYNIWCYGSSAVNFTECEFNCGGKSVLVYNEGNIAGASVCVKNCGFKATQEAEGKAAIEIDSTLLTNGAYYSVNITESKAEGFATGSNSGSVLWNNKTNKNGTLSVMNEVTVDGEKVLKVPVTRLVGSGTEADPFLINNVDELIWFRDKVDELAVDGSTQFAGQYFKLNANIDLAGINWNPIGSMSGDHGSFKGVFDGGGHTISNLYVQQAGKGLGLFARTAGNAEIRNLKLENVTVKSTDNSNYVGGVVGNSYASTKITNVHVTGKIDISGRGYIGGISGHGYVVMDNVSVVGEGTINSTFWCAGGILGYGGEGTTNIKNAHVEGTGSGLTITSAAGGLGAIVGMAEDNNGTQPISGSNLSAKNVNIKTYTGAYGDSYANYALGCLYGGNSTSKLTGNLKAENVVVETSTGETPKIVDSVARIENAYFYKVADALEAVKDGQTIIIMNKEGSEVGKEIEFSKSGTFTITGEAPNYKLPIITVNNETGTTVLNIEKATLAMAEIDARKNATINVIDSTIKGANGNDIVKVYYNGVINVSGASDIDTMQVTVMGRLNLSDSAKITATWQSNVYGNGIITINKGATLDTAGLNVTGQPYDNRDNTDVDRVGKPATILVDGGTLKTLDYDHAYYYEAEQAVLGTGTTSGLIEVINGGVAKLNQINGVTIHSGSAVKVDDGTFVAKNEDGKSVVTVKGSLEMNETVFEGSIFVDTDATVDIKGGGITNTDSTHSAIETIGNLTLTDVKITSARHAVRVEGGTTTINSGYYSVSGTAGMTTHAINAGGGTTEAKVIINGGTFIGPKGTAADSGSAVNVKENAVVEIKDGAFIGGLNDTLNASDDENLIVYGGKFDQNIPVKYLANEKACASGTYPYEGKLYPYAVVDADSIKSDVDIELKGNTTSYSGNFASTEAFEIAKTAAESLKVDDYTLIASVAAIRDELAASDATAKEARAKLNVSDTTPVTTLVQPYMEVVVKEVNTGAVDEIGKTIIGFEIKMLYDVIATTNPADPALGNTVTISTGNVVKNPEAATISFEVLASLINEATHLTAKNRVLYVEHLKADSSVYNHEADLEEGNVKDVISFYNNRGYSTFNLKIAENKVPADKPFQPAGGNSGSSSSNKDSDKEEKSAEPVEVYYAATQSSKVAKTGDASNVALWISIMGIALVAVVAVFVMKKKSSK